ncbi:hypothetical protein [Aliarcobacter cryaerophilus]|uniref:hypothetical protein n=1 Tax=Aliarcobacter cryaerophilus TaxID=28198 RepID=UPI003DA3F6F4
MSVKFRIFAKTCDFCNKNLTNWDYRYKEKHYCRSCYEKYFISKKCIKCNKIKKIHKDSKSHICKFCEVANLPCSRCYKKDFSIGKILKNGVVCKSCAKYYSKLKCCSNCNKEKINVSNRKLKDGHIKMLCTSCYNKTLPICSSCSYRREAHSYDENKNAICKICYEQGFKECKTCNSLIPAGYGNICRNCNNLKTLNNKVNKLSKALSNYFKDSFISFSKWLLQKRDSNFASLKIQHYFKYFFMLDELALNLKRVPTYDEIISNFTVATTREYLLVTSFLDEQNIININFEAKEKQANLDMINKYLDNFQKGSKNKTIIEDYYKFLLEKLEQNKTTIRSIRLALTPAIKFLEYCENFKNNKPSTFLLEGYLWLYSGQKAAITGFINFLRNEKKIDVSLINIKPFKFKKTSTSKTILKQRLLDLMRLPKIPQNKEQLYYRTLIGYLHDIEVPTNLFISINNIKNNEHNNKYILINKYQIYIE